jgi:hypothetical protein
VTDWKRGGYVIRWYQQDHPPRHVHVFKDGALVARFDLEHETFMPGSDRRHFGRIKKALQEEGLI